MLRHASSALSKRWFRFLDLPRQSSPSWYHDRIKEEIEELRAAETYLEKLSEASDVVFAFERARNDGCPVDGLPSSVPSHGGLVYAYMIGKFTSRWAFYRTLAVLCKAPQPNLVREVVNPSKDTKLDTVAFRHRIDAGKFRKVGRRLRRVWPLLP